MIYKHTFADPRRQILGSHLSYRRNVTKIAPPSIQYIFLNSKSMTQSTNSPHRPHPLSISSTPPPTRSSPAPTPPTKPSPIRKLLSLRSLSGTHQTSTEASSENTKPYESHGNGHGYHGERPASPSASSVATSSMGKSAWRSLRRRSSAFWNGMGEEGRRKSSLNLSMATEEKTMTGSTSPATIAATATPSVQSTTEATVDTSRRTNTDVNFGIDPHTYTHPLLNDTHPIDAKSPIVQAHHEPSFNSHDNSDYKHIDYGKWNNEYKPNDRKESIYDAHVQLPSERSGSSTLPLQYTLPTSSQQRPSSPPRLPSLTHLGRGSPPPRLPELKDLGGGGEDSFGVGMFDGI